MDFHILSGGKKSRRNVFKNEWSGKTCAVLRVKENQIEVKKIIAIIIRIMSKILDLYLNLKILFDF